MGNSPCQPAYWAKLTTGARAVVSSPWFEVLDLVLPQAVATGLDVVCLHVPGGYLAYGSSARQELLRGLAEQGRVLVVQGLPRIGTLRCCAWLCIFRSALMRDRMVKQDCSVGWLRMARRETTGVEAARESGRAADR